MDWAREVTVRQSFVYVFERYVYKNRLERVLCFIYSYLVWLYFNGMYGIGGVKGVGGQAWRFNYLSCISLFFIVSLEKKDLKIIQIYAQAESKLAKERPSSNSQLPGKALYMMYQYMCSTGHRSHSVRGWVWREQESPRMHRHRRGQVFGAVCEHTCACVCVCENKLGRRLNSQHGRLFNVNDGCQEMSSPWQQEAIYFAQAWIWIWGGAD